MSWSWRTKPRSILKTIEWFKSFNKLDGENWNKVSKNSSNGNPLHPVRRIYYYNTQNQIETSPISKLSYDEYLSGKHDGKADSESNARNDLATYKFFGFGYISNDGFVKITKAGKMVASDRFDSDTFLKQLLKLKFPAPNVDIGRSISANKIVYPFELILKLINELKYINRFELSYIFLCDDRNEYQNLLNAITEFRENYNSLDNKNNREKCNEIYNKVLEKYFDGKYKMETLSTYGDALIRSLRYTGLFEITGRGNYTKIRVAKYSIKKFDLLLSKHKFKTVITDDLDEYMNWFGDVDNIILPWENENDRKELILDKILLLQNIAKDYNGNYNLDIGINTNELYEKYEIIVDSSELKSFENDLINTITSINEDVFIKYLSKTKEVRDEILTKFDDISSGDEDMAALWLECNTWKSLVAINGNQKVRRNFTIEEDLSPRNFAPGIGNTPDMEVYTDDYILLSEVSLMSGVQQWEHEGSSVIDHVIRFIDEYTTKKVFAIFISNNINIRTNWQFYILNKNSWLNKTIPVIPFTISQYVDLLKYIYENNVNINEFVNLIINIHNNALDAENYVEWNNRYEEIIKEWKENLKGE